MIALIGWILASVILIGLTGWLLKLVISFVLLPVGLLAIPGGWISRPINDDVPPTRLVLGTIVQLILLGSCTWIFVLTLLNLTHYLMTKNWFPPALWIASLYWSGIPWWMINKGTQGETQEQQLACLSLTLAGLILQFSVPVVWLVLAIRSDWLHAAGAWLPYGQYVKF